MAMLVITRGYNKNHDFYWWSHHFPWTPYFGHPLSHEALDLFRIGAAEAQNAYLEAEARAA